MEPAKELSGGLPRVIGLWGGTALIVGITIGSGIFRKPPTIAGLVPDPAIILGLWVAFGIICLCGALALAELASMLPRTGGIYVYIRAAYGDGAAFVFGWLYLLVSAPAAIGALAMVFMEFLLGAMGISPKTVPGWLVPAGAISMILVLSGLNILGTRLGSAVQTTLTVIKVAALAALIVVAFMVSGGSFGHMASTGGPVDRPALARAVSSVIWTYDGWIGVSMIAGEVLAPDKLLKRIIIAGMLVIVALYVAANVGYFYAMPVGAMAKENAGIAANLVSGVLGPAAGVGIGLCIVASVLGALTANILTRPRVAYAMAKDGLTFSVFGRSHPRWATPHVAIMIQALAAIALVLSLQDFDKLTTYFVVVEWFALLFAVGAIFVLRRGRMANAPRPFRTPLYPVVPLVFVLGTLVGLATIVWGEWSNGNYSPVYGLGIAAAGFPIYLLVRKKMV